MRTIGSVSFVAPSETELKGMLCSTWQRGCDILMTELYSASNIWAVFSISLCPAQSTAGGRKKEKATDDLQAGQAGGEAPYESPWGKNKALDMEQFWKLHPWLILWGGKLQR